MGEEYRGKVFKSGNSVALRLPKALGLAEGAELRIVDMGDGCFNLQPIETKPRIDVDSFWGSMPGFSLPANHNREFEDRPSARQASGLSDA